jgi:hypothetical protein
MIELPEFSNVAKESFCVVEIQSSLVAELRLSSNAAKVEAETRNGSRGLHNQENIQEDSMLEKKFMVEHLVKLSL